MLKAEAQWFELRINQIGVGNLAPLLNVGSGSAQFREVVQPWINRHIFRQFAEQKGEIIHFDQKLAGGVDFAGDFFDSSVRTSLQKMNHRSVMACNFLEHVDEIGTAADLIWSLVPLKGFLLISCPFRYPVHPDPIDNGFRPSPDQLAALFPGAQIIAQQIVTCETWGHYLAYEHSLKDTLKSLVGLILPFPNIRKWLQRMSYAPYILKPFQTTCLILKKLEQHVEYSAAGVVANKIV